MYSNVSFLKNLNLALESDAHMKPDFARGRGGSGNLFVIYLLHFVRSNNRYPMRIARTSCPRSRQDSASHPEYEKFMQSTKTYENRDLKNV